LADLEQAVAGIGTAPPPTDLGPVEAQLASLSSQVATLGTTPAGPTEEYEAAVTRLAGLIGSPGDGSSSSTVFGRLSLNENMIMGVGQLAADAASKAQLARSEASNLMASIGSLEALILANDTEGIRQQVVELGASLLRLQEAMADVPTSVQLTHLQNEVNRIAQFIDQFASSQGVKVLMGLEPDTGIPGLPGEGEPKSVLDLLNEVKQLKEDLAAIQAILDASENAPDVKITFTGEVE